MVLEIRRIVSLYSTYFLIREEYVVFEYTYRQYSGTQHYVHFE